MTERLSDVAARIASVGQLSQVIGAMRGIAAARSREARGRLEGVRAHARAVGEAIGQALTFVADEPPPAATPEDSGRHAVIAFGAEQGFAGSFNARVLDALERLVGRSRPRRVELLLLGDRGRAAAEQRGVAIDGFEPMVAHLDQAPALADRIVGRLFDRLGSGQVARVTALYASPRAWGEIEIEEKTLAPFDFRRFPRARRAAPPLITMAPHALLSRLAEEYMFAEIYEALILSFAAENEARLRAMTAARSHISEMLDRLTARARALRQEEITNEIIELGADSGAANASPTQRRSSVSR